MYSKLVSFNDGLYKVYKVIMMILLAVMSVWVFAAVILRETGTSAPWIEEFTIYAFSWLTYFGAACVLRDDGHLSVTAVTNMINGRRITNREALGNPESLDYFEALLPELQK